MPRINLDDIVESKTIQSTSLSPPPEVSQLESAIRGGAQGVSLGFADEATARLESIAKGIPYEQALQETREKYRQAQEANPVTYTGSEVAGGFAIPFGGIAKAGGTILSKLPIATKTIQSAKNLSPLSKTIASGGVLGGTTSLGLSEGKTSGEILSDVGIGTALGLGISGVASKLIPKKLQQSISKEADKTISNQATQSTGQKLTEEAVEQSTKQANKDAIQQTAKKTEIPLKDLEESLKNAKSAVEDNLNYKIEQADEIISTLTGKKTSLINYLRQNPEKSKQIAEITNTVQKSDDLARILTDYATKNPTRREGIVAAAKGKKILQDSNIRITNEDIFNILDKSRNRIIEKNPTGISDPLNIAQKEIDKISEKIIEQQTYDGTALRNLLSNLDDQVNKYGGYYNIADQNKPVQNELKKVRGELNNYIKNQLPEDVRNEYSKQYSIASQKLNQAENIEAILTSKKASMRAKGTNIGDLEKANTILNRYISRPTAGKESEVDYLSKLLKEEKPSLNLKDELDKIRIAKQIESKGNEGSNIVNTFRGMAKVNLPEFPGSKILSYPIEKMLEGEAAFIGQKLGTKGGKIAQEWADYSGQLIKEGKIPSQLDAYKFIISQSTKEMQPGFRQSLYKKFGANLPEEKIPVNLPSPEQIKTQSMGLPSPIQETVIPSESVKQTNKYNIPSAITRGKSRLNLQQGIQTPLLDEFLNQNRREVERNEFLKQNQNRVK